MSGLKVTFKDLGLQLSVIKALDDLGYKKPSPIQIKCIPYLLAGKDVLGLAQTGSGKTAAFSLPMLNNINSNLHVPQILILVPTRELAIQVTEAIVCFSKYMINIKVVALYGGQNHNMQLRFLRNGPQIIVGTPGRLLDHLKHGVINFSNIKSLVLDEADEMLRMGFIEDVENIIEHIPKKRQTALFSATMPKLIRRITNRFMRNPQEIYIKPDTTIYPEINQSYCSIHGINKKEALIRFLEIEEFDAAIIFVRTKNSTLIVAEILERNGYKGAALNGDMNQTLREKTISGFKSGSLDILIATDIAARGLDVERVNLIINYDIPMDFNSYIHRIGRTGRAGRVGRALLFVENYERHLLFKIKRNIKSIISEVKLPNTEVIIKRRLEKFIIKLQKQLESDDLNQYEELTKKIRLTMNNEKISTETLAAALLKMAQGERNLIISLHNKSFNDNYIHNNDNYSNRRNIRNYRNNSCHKLKKISNRKFNNLRSIH